MTNKKSALEQLKQIVEEAKLMEDVPIDNDPCDIKRQCALSILELAERVEALETRTLHRDSNVTELKKRTLGEIANLKRNYEEHRSQLLQLWQRVKAKPETNDARTIELPDDEFEAFARSLNRDYSDEDVSKMQQLRAKNQTFIRAKKSETK